MNPTRAQKIRLAVFVLVTATIFIATVVTLIGTSLLEQRDAYTVRIAGSISGLEKGAQVRYNGIRVGRVDSMRIDRDNPGEVELTLSLDAGTPITRDTVAVLNMQGITGLKYIELTGGDADSELLEPGSEIPSAGSDFDLLTERAFAISQKIESLLDNLVTATSGENLGRLTGVLDETQAVLRNAELLLADNRGDVRAIVQNARASSDSLNQSIDELRLTLTALRTTVSAVGTWIDPAQVRSIIAKLGAVLDEAQARLSAEELGQTIASTTELVGDTKRFVNNADVTLLRTRDDLRRALDELATSTENLTEFTQILVDNPSALISGRSERERPLP